MTYTTVLWDLDGTIVDSAPGIFESFIHTFTTLGLPVPPVDEMRSFMGPPLPVTFGEILGFEPALAAECLNVYREKYLRGGGAQNCQLFPGMVDLVERNRAAGRANSLATSKGLSGVEVIGEMFGILDLFDVLGTASNDQTRSAKKDVVTYALDELQKQGADLTRTVLIGDRIHDVEGAREHGIDVILVKWGYGNQAEWAEADALAETPEHLAELLGL
ncbi:HAD hydrolase-like protein [Rhodoluna limnophila]|uniref:HAD hydrolase-like protein n=1 Tax=Rhodoluna limnophila TaxID=232537 RepID=UPI001562B45B|nr:HAD hydrolase-like protein [Rhodoluna limnophila]